ncbi:MAG: acyltransferase family protein [Dehalococcoidia bacterium]
MARPDVGDGGARVGWLDGARGIAILAVMVFHFVWIAGPSKPEGFAAWIAGVSGAGWAGVDLFFVLSGFLITGILVDAKSGRTNYFRNFYARRFLRIFPLYYGFLALVLVALPLIEPIRSREYQTLQHSQGWYWTYLTNVWIALRDGRSVDLYGMGHLWSLAVEEQFYLIWPVVVLLCSRRALMYVCAGAITGSFVLRLVLDQHGVDPFVSYTLTPTRVDALAAGALVALALRDAGDRRVAARLAGPVAAASAVAVAAVVVATSGFSNLDGRVIVWGLTPLALLFASVMTMQLTAASAPPVARWCSVAALRFLGRYSYGLYVLHWPIATWLAWQIPVHAMLPAFPGSPLLSEALFAALAFTLSMTAAWLSWHLYEKQFLKLKRYFPYARVRVVTRAEAAADRPAPAPGEFAPTAGTEPRAA